MSKTINGIDGVARHYGFETAEFPPVHIDNESPFCLEEKTSTLKSYLSNNFIKKDYGVSMIYNNKKSLGGNQKKQPSNLKNFSFDIVGIKNGIAEAIVIQTAIVALKEEGFKDISIDINSIGDKESFALFKNELFDYYKKRVSELHPNCRKLNKKNIFALLTCEHEECQSLRANAPKSIYFLSENSQRHLKEVLEHLESTGITYCINDSLISSGNHFSKVIFEIKSRDDKKDKEILLGKGGRYDELARRVIRKKELTAVGVSLGIEQTKNKQTRLPSEKKPKFYFIQFGPKAKLQSLSLIELLRQSGLVIKQNLYMDKFSEQIEMAKRSDIHYAIILGQKEASDDTVIVKDLRKASQEIISTCNLLPYLRQLK